MNRRKTDLVMIDRGFIARCDHPCQCENGQCARHADTACEFFAETIIQFPGSGTFALCVRCRRQYETSGYRYGSEPMPTPHSIPSQSHVHDRLLSDELTSMNEYTRRERQGF